MHENMRQLTILHSFGLSYISWEIHYVYLEMDIYRDNLSVIVIGDNFLSIIVQNSLDLSITVIAFVIFCYRR